MNLRQGQMRRGDERLLVALLLAQFPVVLGSDLLQTRSKLQLLMPAYTHTPTPSCGVTEREGVS